MTKPITFTLLTACKNEEKDIRLALESSLSQTYPHTEIIFVDDSTDGTKDIIRSYTDRGVRLIDGPGHGCCIARNVGMRQATGDVIVFLTADTLLEPTYLERILPYYEQGFDWVTVEAFSYNVENVYARFVEMQHRFETHKSTFDPFTSQGYSVRRDVALAVGLIDGDVYPFNTCRDWTLGKKLTERGYKKMDDRSIIVRHKSPDTFAEYWLVRKTRGLFSAYQPYFMFHRPLWYLFFKFIVKDALNAFHFLFFVPAWVRVSKIARHSDRGIQDCIPFFYAYTLQQFAFCVGEWQGWWNILQYRLKKKVCAS